MMAKGFLDAIRAASEKPSVLGWLAFFLCLIVFGLAPFGAALKGTERYAVADWGATNIWLESAECARQRGAWLSICDGDRLVPISEYAIADDPGHALLLGLWARVSDRVLSVPDAFRLNVALNAAGLIALASLLFAMRAYVTSIVLLVLGPLVYSYGIGVSPHSGFMGVASMAAVLPIALLAKEGGLLPGWYGYAYVAVGLVGFSLAALVREPIGVMALVISIGAIGAVVWRRLRARSPLLGLVVVASLIFVAFSTPKWVVLARDVSFAMEPTQRLQTHGISHTLYIGLGVVENRLGIRYDDYFGKAIAESIAPDVVFCSPEYFQIMWKLYWGKVTEAPLEVMRVYFEKSKLVLADSIRGPALPMSFVLAFVVIHFLVVTAFGAWRKIGFPQGPIIEAIALAFTGLFVAQGILALPDRMYSIPADAFLVVLLGVILESIGRWVLVRRTVRSGRSSA